MISRRNNYVDGYLPKLCCSWCSTSGLVARVPLIIPLIGNYSAFFHRKSVIQIVLLILVIHSLNKYFKLLIEGRYAVKYCLCLQGYKGG